MKQIKIIMIWMICCFCVFLSKIVIAMPMAGAGKKKPASRARAVPMSTVPAARPMAQGQQAPSIPSAAPATQVSQVSIEQKELEQINTHMKKIDALEDEMKAGLKNLDAKIHLARNRAAGAKKLGFDILKQETERQARDIFDQLKANMVEIDKVQDFAQREFATFFTEKVSEMKVLMSQVESTVKNLQARGVQFNMMQAQEGVGMPQQKHIAQESPKKMGSKPAHVKEKPRTITGKIWHKITELTARFVNMVKRSLNWFLAPTVPVDEKPEKKDLVKKKIKKAPIASKTSKIPTMGMGEAQTLPTLKQQAQADINTLNTIIDQLDALQLNFTQQFDQIRTVLKDFRNQLHAIQVIHEYLVQTKKEKKVSHAYWKIVAIHIFSKLLDVVSFVGRTIWQFVHKIYNYFFAGIVSTFTRDVKKKLYHIEKRDVKEATQKE